MTIADVGGSKVFPDGSSLVRARAVPWSPWISPGTRFKLLDVDLSFHKMTLLVEADAGAVLDAYRHGGAAEYFIEAGAFECSRGALASGDYLYEPGGSTLRGVRFTVASQVYLQVHGPLRKVLMRDAEPDLFDLDWHLGRARVHGAADHLSTDLE